MDLQDIKELWLQVIELRLNMMDEEFHPKSEGQVGDFHEVDIATSFSKNTS